MNDYVDKKVAEILSAQKVHYRQIEDFIKLNSQVSLTFALPTLRGWAMSPDALLYIHQFIRVHKPSTIIEFGSGASTLVVADALRQNAQGKVYSIDHLSKYGNQTNASIFREPGLSSFVEIFIADIKDFSGQHISDDDSKYWYDETVVKEVLSKIDEIDLVIVDGPPGFICSCSRYPAIPKIYHRLSNKAVIFLDDSNRKHENLIANSWVDNFNLDVDYFKDFEKGLAVLIKRQMTSE